MPSPLRSIGAALVVAAPLLLSSCGEPADTGDDPGPTTPAASSPGTPTSPSTGPSDPATDGTATSEPSTGEDPQQPTGLRALLPSAAQLPGLNEQWRWQVVRTVKAQDDPFGVCAPAGMLTLGAERGVLRQYRAADGTGPTAQALAVTFPDRTNTQRARQVQASLRDRCAQRLEEQGHADAKVHDLTTVPTANGAAAWYLASWPTDGDDGHFHAFGYFVQGNEMVLLTMDSDGQDYNYPPGEEPMALALEQVASLAAAR